jgi:hypothetical protein
MRTFPFYESKYVLRETMVDACLSTMPQYSERTLGADLKRLSLERKVGVCA